jgi:HD-like signal output (HDOD) protein
VIQQDPGMAAKILQLVNSSFFGTQRRITSPTEAAVLLGMATIRSLVLSLDVFAQFERDADGALGVGALQSHSLGTALFAKRIVEHEKGSRQAADEAFLSGLLHDLGKLVLAANLPEQYLQASSRAQPQQPDLERAEREVFGATHAEIGAYLLGLWGLPATVVEAVARHHCPGCGSSDTLLLLAAVHVADAFERRQVTPDPAPHRDIIDVDFLTRVGLADRIELWWEACHDVLTEGTPT